MKAEEFKIKVTNRKTEESCIISLDDIFGYEGVEASGVFICYKPEIPDSFQGVSDYKIEKMIEGLGADGKS